MRTPALKQTGRDVAAPRSSLTLLSTGRRCQLLFHAFIAPFHAALHSPPFLPFLPLFRLCPATPCDLPPSPATPRFLSLSTLGATNHRNLRSSPFASSLCLYLFFLSLPFPTVPFSPSFSILPAARRPPPRRSSRALVSFTPCRRSSSYLSLPSCLTFFLGHMPRG